MPEETRARFMGQTFHYRDFDLHTLADRKRALATTVSVVIPARDEEDTVGGVVGVVHDELLERIGLVDELLVVDGESRDRTAKRAREAGARVVSQAEALSEAGAAVGKGDALWQGLAASRGELVVFVDADIQEFDTRCVTGLLGPLLADASVAFVKAAYDRPLRVGDEIHPVGGGRVTELLARPLLATFWPELSWLAQPLSGEYAGRRSLLERVPFVRGYGVELALLIDIVELAGVEVIAQVDLERRLHRHQPLPALGRMATEILHVSMDRLTTQGRMVLSEPLAYWLPQPDRDSDGRLRLGGSDVTVSQRPPLSSGRSPA